VPVFNVDTGHPVDGIAVALPNTMLSGTNVSNNVFVNDNDGTLVRIDVNNGNAVSVVASGGSRGDFATVGPDNCLYVTQSDRVEKMSPCFFQVAAISCPPSGSVNARWHYSANGSAGSWSTTGSTSCKNGSVVIGPQAMAGDLKVMPGAPLMVGYDFALPGNTATFTASVSNPRVGFTARCVSGAAPSTGTFTVSMPNQTYTVSNQNWYPSGDQQSPLVYQGTIAVPDLCGSGKVRLDQGGTFSATILLF